MPVEITIQPFNGNEVIIPRLTDIFSDSKSATSKVSSRPPHRLSYLSIKLFSKVETALTSILIASLLVVALFDQFSPENSSSCRYIADSPLQQVFSSSENQHFAVLGACLISVFTASMLLLDTIFDRLLSVKPNPLEDFDVRMQVIGLTFCPLVILVAYFSPHSSGRTAYYYAISHSIEYIGLFGCVLRVLFKHYPLDFPGLNVIYLMATMSTGVVSSMLGFCESRFHAFNIFTLIASFLVFIPFMILVVRWIFRRNLLFRHNSSFEEKEIICIVYIVAILVMLTTSSVLVMRTFSVSWLLMEANSTALCVASVVSFSVLVSCIPGRISKLRYTESQLSVIAMKRTLIRFISHEVRTPLMIARLSIGFIGDDMKNHFSSVPEAMSESVQESMNACDSAINILNNMLLYETYDDGKLQISCEQKSIKHLSKLTRSCLGVAIAHGLNVSFKNFITEDIFMYIDLGRLDQIFHNLVMNAVKSTPAGGSVSIRVHKIDKYGGGNDDQGVLLTVKDICPDSQRWIAHSDIVIDITDTGRGIDDPARVLKELTNANNLELQGGAGSGLGLWISHQLVELHGGILSFKSEGLDMGTTFSIRISGYSRSPSVNGLENSSSLSRFSLLTGHKSKSSKAAAVVPFNEAAKVNETSERDYSSGKCLRIMIVDDSAICRKVIRGSIDRLVQDAEERVLSFGDHKFPIYVEFVEADDGVTAIDTVKNLLSHSNDSPKQNPVDIILMDNVMINMNGPVCASILRGMGVTCDIFGITGNVIQSDIDEFIAAGATKVIGKPISKDSLREILHLDKLVTELTTR